MRPSTNLLASDYITQITTKKTSLLNTVGEFKSALDKSYDKSYAVQKMKINVTDINGCLLNMGNILDDCNRWIDIPKKETPKSTNNNNNDSLVLEQDKLRQEPQSSTPVLNLFAAPSENLNTNETDVSISKTTPESQQDKNINRTLNYPYEVKSKVLALCKDMSVKKVSAKMGISTQTIYSWIKKKSNYKKSKRCTTRDLNMESELIRWISEWKTKEGKYPSPKSIREKALELTSCDKFKASIAWYHKFMKRSRPRFTTQKTGN